MFCRSRRRSRFSCPLPVPSVIAHPILKSINRYLRLTEVGRGSSSKVYVARDRQNGQFYALKQIHLTKTSRSQIESELTLLTSLSHPNIMRLHEILQVRDSGTIYIVTDFAECGSLEAILQHHDNLPLHIAQYIFKEIATGIAYLHSLRIVHQDVKPGNVLLTKSGRVFLSDFGMSHSFETEAAVFGTPFYQAPEVLDSVDVPACERGKEDIWALGITLFQMIFGTPPFKGGDVYTIVAAIRQTRLSPPKPTDPQIWKLICGMLMVDPKERWNIEEVMESGFVKGAPSQTDFSGFHETQIEEIDRGAPIVEVEAVVFLPVCSFADGRTLKWRSHSDPQ